MVADMLISSTTISMSATIYAGLAVTSHNDGTLCNATFDGFSLGPWNASGGTAINLIATPITPGRIDLQWGDGATNEFSYAIELSTDGAHFVSAGQAYGSAGYSLTELAPPTTYFVRLRGEFSDGPG